MCRLLYDETICTVRTVLNPVCKGFLHVDFSTMDRDIFLKQKKQLCGSELNALL